MPRSNRRQFLQTTAAVLAGATAVRAAPEKKDACTLSIGTYSLKGIALEEAIPLVAAIGFDGIEIATQPGFDGEPSKMPADRRKRIREAIATNNLKLTALMEQISPSADDTKHRADVERIGRAADLARDLNPSAPPLIQTVLGGGTWDALKTLFRDRLRDWVDETARRGVTLAIKPHRGGALSRPDEAIWLIRQLGEPHHLKMVYDYSHYAYRDLPLEETVRESLPYTAHLVVKDAVRKEGRIAFALPGESGTFDYPKLLRLFHDGGYHGDVCCEVSSQVSSKPGYDPRAAAKTCYMNMAQAFETAQVPRGSG